MRILLITDNHTPTGGAERYFFELKEKLKTLPDVTVYSIGFAPKASEGDDFHVLPSATSKVVKFLFRLFTHPLVYFKLHKLITHFQPDVIHLHNVKQFPFSVLRAIRGYPLVHTMHDFSFICPTAQNIHRDLTPCPTGIRRACFWQHQIKYPRFIYLFMAYAFFKLRRLLKQTAHAIIAPSPLLAEYLTRNHFHHVTYISPFHTKPSSFSFNTIKPYHFLFAGHLGKHKGVSLLLNEFALACQHNNKLVLNIAGTGPEKKPMQQQVRALGIINNVNFLDWQDNLSAHYEACNALIFPSLGLESFGLVMTEAMSHARPIIAINRGTCAWLVKDQENGLLFDPLLAGDCASKILALAENTDLVKRLGTQGRAQLHTLMNNEAALQQILQVYQTVIDNAMDETER